MTLQLPLTGEAWMKRVWRRLDELSRHNHAPDETLHGDVASPVLANGWVDYGGVFAPGSYYKDRGHVYLEGLIKSGTIGQAAFVLPVGFRPAGQLIFAPAGASGESRVDVLADGSVVPNAPTTNGFVSLEGINFRAAG